MTLHVARQKIETYFKLFPFLSYLVYIDENGDAAGNYTILSIKGVKDNASIVYGLYPVGTFSAPNRNQIPVCINIFKNFNVD